MTIHEIEALTYSKVKEMAIEIIKIKDHDCVFAELGVPFSYSVLIFRNGKHIYSANDYELHHSNLVKTSDRSRLREFYISALNQKLFTDQELLESIQTYEEYTRKIYFLRNYWIMQYERKSIFGIGVEAAIELEKAKKVLKYYNPISYCYVASKEIIRQQSRLLENLEKSFSEIKFNDDIFREMVSCELANHEACITCSYKDALNSLGLDFEELSDSRKKIVLKELQKQIQNSY